MRTALDDLASAWRSLASQRGLTAAAVLTLAVGVSAGTVGFVTLRTLAQPDSAIAEPEKVARVWRVDPLLGNDRGQLTLELFRELQPAVRSLELAAFVSDEEDVVRGSARLKSHVQRVAGRYLTVLGVEPELGRLLEGTPGEDGAVLSFELWQRLFEGDVAALGQLLEIDGQDRPIVGVAPPGFGFPTAGTDLWLTLPAPPTSTPVSVVARLAEAATWEAATLELNAAYRRSVEPPQGARPDQLRVVTVAAEAAKRSRLGLVGMLGPGLLLLTIACVNAALLLLARAATRSREIAVRAALGASRIRIVRQLLAEGAVIALVAAPLAALLAMWGLSAVRATLAFAPAAAARITFGGDLALGILALSVVTPLLFALAPAVHAARADVIAALGRGAHRPSLRFGRYRGPDLLVTLEMALATILLVWSGLFVRFLWELESRVPVTAPDRVILAKPPKPGAMRGDIGLAELLENLDALPGIERVAAADGLPSPMTRATTAFAPRAEASEAIPVQLVRTTLDGLQALGLPIGRGRDFDASDRAGVCVVSERIARRLWPDADPLGHRLYPVGSPGEAAPPLGIVGVFSDLSSDSPGELGAPAVYALDADPALGYLLLRTAIPASGLLEQVRAALADAEPGEPWVVETVAETLRGHLREPGFMLRFIGAFGVISLVLAGLGAHGVMRQAVRSRLHELGVRIAVGAGRGDVARLVLRHGLSLVAVGVLVGSVLTLVTTRIAWSTLVMVSSGDPWTVLAVVAPLALVSVAACFGPLLDATHLDPLAVLRQD